MCKVILGYTYWSDSVAKELNFVILLDCYGDLLTEHQKNIMELYYCEDLSLSEIGTPIGITRQAVRDLIKRSEAILINYEEKLHFAEKTSKMKKCFGKISELAENISDTQLKNGITAEVRNALDLL